MRNMFDFSSWSSLITTVLGLLQMTLMMMGVRLLFMQTIQKRRERENRQINERLRTLMAAYKTLGSSFTGNLTVSPVHLRNARTHANAPADEGLLPDADDDSAVTGGNSERQRRTRDTVEAALSDIILLGTEEQVRMAAQAAQDMVAGRPVQTAALVSSLRQFIRAAARQQLAGAAAMLKAQRVRATASVLKVVAVAAQGWAWGWALVSARMTGAKRLAPLTPIQTTSKT